MVFLFILTIVTASIPRRAKDTGVENCFVAQCICQYWGLIMATTRRFSFASWVLFINDVRDPTVAYGGG